MEMEDLRNSQNLAMRVVPVTAEEIKIHTNGAYLAFLAAFGIRKAS